MSKSVWFAALGVAFLELDTWVWQTMWLALVGVVMLVYSMFLISQEAK